MKSYIHTKYGPPDVIELVEQEIPVPKDNEVLVKIHAASVNALDWHLLTADFFLVRLMSGGVFKPKSTWLGADIAGVVEAAGKDVTMFKVGDAVYGDTASTGRSGFAEYITAPEKLLAPKPDVISFEQAAAIPVAGITAVQGLRDNGKLQPGERVLIYGAAGGVGTFAVQIAKAWGGEVTAVSSSRNLEQSRLLGADHVIDYTKEDVTRSGVKYDLILGVNGYHTLGEYQRILAPQGRYVMAGGKLGQIMQAMALGSFKSKKGGQQFSGVSAHASRKDLLVINEMIEAGQVTPAVDQVFPFAQTREAVAYLGTGHARAKVVIQVAEGG